MTTNLKDKLVTLESLDIVYSEEQDTREAADLALSTRIDNIVAAAQSGGGGGSSTLSGLTDTSISGQTDGQMLIYDGTAQKWVNHTPSGGGSVTVDTILSGTSTNPVQNKVIKQALDSKAGTDVATTSANGLMSATDKSHLDSVYADYSAAIAALGA